jgi:hypothetical protein
MNEPTGLNDIGCFLSFAQHIRMIVKVVTELLPPHVPYHSPQSPLVEKGPCLHSAHYLGIRYLRYEAFRASTKTGMSSQTLN